MDEFFLNMDKYITDCKPVSETCLALSPFFTEVRKFSTLLMEIFTYASHSLDLKKKKPELSQRELDCHLVFAIAQGTKTVSHPSPVRNKHLLQFNGKNISQCSRKKTCKISLATPFVWTHCTC